MHYTRVREDAPPGSYWRVIDPLMQQPIRSDWPENLTGLVYAVVTPNGCGPAVLTRHTVREHDDGTISVRPDDGSSNSILITDRHGTWHGYIEHGVWAGA